MGGGEIYGSHSHLHREHCLQTIYAMISRVMGEQVGAAEAYLPSKTPGQGQEEQYLLRSSQGRRGEMRIH